MCCADRDESFLLVRTGAAIGVPEGCEGFPEFGSVGFAECGASHVQFIVEYGSGHFTEAIVWAVRELLQE